MTTPSMEVRLATIARALEQVIIPALPSEEVLAREQAALSIVHLTTIAEQCRYLAEYELACFADMSTLAEALAGAAEGGPHTASAARELHQILNAVRAATSSSTAHDRRNTLARAIDSLIQASAQDGSPGFQTAQYPLIVDHGNRQANHDRAWFRRHGIDPDAEMLPAIPELIADMGAH